MKHIENTHNGIIHFRNNQTGASVDLKPGLNHVDEATYKLFEKRFVNEPGLIYLESFNDTPDRKEESEAPVSNEESDLPEAPRKPSKSERKAARKLESLNE